MKPRKLFDVVNTNLFIVKQTLFLKPTKNQQKSKNKGLLTKRFN
jgi:hypothetical protein